LQKIARAARRDEVHDNRDMRTILGGKLQRARLIDREQLRAGDFFRGPAVVSEYSATTLVPGGWRAQVDAYGQILLRQTRKARRDGR
jgi:N-methylhydantoinase A/oxoprolinase/acetone carboxylase beta subunit